MKKRENQVIEKMLYDAQKNLPNTNTDWRVLEMKEEKSKKKPIKMLQRIAASIAVVLALGIGGITVFANMEVNVGDGEYGIWTEIISRSWGTCEIELEKRGAILPESFGEYKFGELFTGLVVKQGTTYLEAFQDKVYHPMSASYYDGVPGEPCNSFTVSIGTLNDPFWSAYYEYNFVDGIWVAEEAEMSFEYEGMVIYGSEVNYEESGKHMQWTWLDESNGICFWTSFDSEIDSTEIIKAIIDMNK